MDDRDPEAFRALYRAHYRTVCRFLTARTDRGLVEDVAAETFLVAWRRQSELPSEVVPWLLATARRCLANQRRARGRRDALVDRLGELIACDAGGVEDALARREELRAVLSALAACTERERELLLLSYWDGLAPREIAAVLELNPVLLRARLHRASRRLREALAGEETRPGPAAPRRPQNTIDLTET
ncbi:MAG TPA: sigma-70 family RNA polymerase sigma factor [Solirubrobacteraceae bacterium]|nr:sigma-70 family RNA polymerase sigma factor [Solirubrobacteraceae bacterium]